MINWWPTSSWSTQDTQAFQRPSISLRRELAVVIEAVEVGFGCSGRNVGLVNAGMWIKPDDVAAGGRKADARLPHSRPPDQIKLVRWPCPRTETQRPSAYASAVAPLRAASIAAMSI